MGPTPWQNLDNPNRSPAVRPLQPFIAAAGDEDGKTSGPTRPENVRSPIRQSHLDILPDRGTGSSCSPSRLHHIKTTSSSPEEMDRTPSAGSGITGKRRRRRSSRPKASYPTLTLRPTHRTGTRRYTNTGSGGHKNNEHARRLEFYNVSDQRRLFIAQRPPDPRSEPDAKLGIPPTPPAPGARQYAYPRIQHTEDRHERQQSGDHYTVPEKDNPAPGRIATTI